MTDDHGPRPGTLGQRIQMPKVLADAENAVRRAAASLRPNTPEYIPMPGAPVYGSGNNGGVQQQPKEGYSTPGIPESMHEHPAAVTQSGRPLNSVEAAIHRECWEICQMLCEKNQRYGNSALSPIRVFSDAHPVEQILVRIDDKLSRIRSGNWGQGEDTIKDLIGYLVLLRLAQNGVR